MHEEDRKIRENFVIFSFSFVLFVMKDWFMV